MAAKHRLNDAIVYKLVLILQELPNAQNDIDSILIPFLKLWSDW